VRTSSPLVAVHFAAGEGAATQPLLIAMQVQVKRKTHIPPPPPRLANRDGHDPHVLPIMPDSDSIPRTAFQLHLISYRAIKPYMGGNIAVSQVCEFCV
jgi:hypothetical protein